MSDYVPWMPVQDNCFPGSGDSLCVSGEGLCAIFLDMDGVLADFVGGVARVFGKARERLEQQYEIPPALDMSKKSMWDIINMDGQRFWTELDELHGADELVGFCQDTVGLDEVSILTRLPHHGQQYAAAGKMQWLSRRQWAVLPHIHMTTNKASIVPTAGHLLVDDSDDECDKWRKAGGSAIVYPQPWNSAREHIGERFQWVASQVEIIRTQILA